DCAAWSILKMYSGRSRPETLEQRDRAKSPGKETGKEGRTMDKTLTFGRRLAAGFGFTALVLLIVAAVSYKNTNDLIENERLVAHSHEVRTNLAFVLSSLASSESRQRGYI